MTRHALLVRFESGDLPSTAHSTNHNFLLPGGIPRPAKILAGSLAESAGFVIPVTLTVENTS